MTKTVSTLAIVLICFAAFANCWWEVGHMAVTQIAEKRLKELGQTDALEHMVQLVQAFAPLSDGRSNTFVEGAVWADDIKEYNATYFDNYHFTDIVYDPTFMFVSMTDPQKDVNSINVANSAISVLKTNKNALTF